jgi:Fur family transcriptional regulator, ferric uptake regulator
MGAERAMRMTPQRQIILEEIERAQSHPTADEIYGRVRSRLPRISLGTVYRNLDLLVARGMIQRLDLGGGQRRFDVISDLHYHIRCLECGTLANVFLKSPSLFKDMLQDANDYEIYGVRLEFLGLCPKCKHKKSSAT